MTHTRRSVVQIGQDIRWGIIRATPFVVFFGGIALVAELFGVKFAGLNIERTIFVYVTFGLLIGVLVGLFRPIILTFWGTGIIGAIIGVPLALYIRILAVGAGDWTLADIVIVLILIGACVVCALAFRRGYIRAEERSRMGRPS